MLHAVQSKLYKDKSKTLQYIVSHPFILVHHPANLSCLVACLCTEEQGLEHQPCNRQEARPPSEMMSEEASWTRKVACPRRSGCFNEQGWRSICWGAQIRIGTVESAVSRALGATEKAGGQRGQLAGLVSRLRRNKVHEASRLVEEQTH